MLNCTFPRAVGDIAVPLYYYQYLCSTFVSPEGDVSEAGPEEEGKLTKNEHTN